MTNSAGRLVMNHSTHIPGLIPVLERLCQQIGVRTVTPGVIGQARAHAPKLALKISVPIRGGFKIMARQGKTFQEVFIVTTLDKADLETAIAQAMRLK